MMQSSEQEREELAIIKKRATLDSVPEDVALLIVEVMKGWVLKGKSLKEKKQATKARDSTLGAMVLSCRKNFHLYFPALLENVTIDAANLISIQNLFERENYGYLVRSLHVKALPSGFSKMKASFLWDDFTAISGLPSSVDSKIRFQQGLIMVLTSIFRNVSSIETLIIESSIYIDGLFFERHTFLTNSLKSLYVSSDKRKMEGNLSVRNGLWLLLFLPSASEVALGTDFSIKDLELLSEVGDTVEGLSRVSKLSLQIHFVWNDAKSKTWWGLERDSHRYSALGNQKTFAVSQLLRCVNTSQLISLEVVGNLDYQREGDYTLLLVECLTVLHRSFNSLLHLRLIGLSFREDRPDSKWFSNFKNMRMLTLEYDVLQGLKMCNHVPSSLEVIWVPYYTDEDFVEEDLLGQFIQRSRTSLPRLREVVVPKFPLLLDKDVIGNVQKWTTYRERLEKEEIFTSGRVNLRKAEDSEMFGDPSKPGEVFLSSQRWVSW